MILLMILFMFFEMTQQIWYKNPMAFSCFIYLWFFEVVHILQISTPVVFLKINQPFFSSLKIYD